jgi:hypothetical protein
MERQSGEPPGAMLIQPTGLVCPGEYLARTLSNVLVKDAMNKFKVHHGPQVEERLKESKVNPVEIRAVKAQTSRHQKETMEDGVSCYCIVELLNTNAELLQLCKNVKFGEGEPLGSHGNDHRND